MAKIRDAFLNELIHCLRVEFEGEGVDVSMPNIPVEWPGQPGQFWPKADVILTDKNSGHRFIIESDEDSDPGRSLVKYWPHLDKYGSASFTFIEVWKRGQTYGMGYFELAKFMAQKLGQVYPSFSCHFIERTSETAKQIAQKIYRIVKQANK